MDFWLNFCFYFGIYSLQFLGSTITSKYLVQVCWNIMFTLDNQIFHMLRVYTLTIQLCVVSGWFENEGFYSLQLNIKIVGRRQFYVISFFIESWLDPRQPKFCVSNSKGITPMKTIHLPFSLSKQAWPLCFAGQFSGTVSLIFTVCPYIVIQGHINTLASKSHFPCCPRVLTLYLKSSYSEMRKTMSTKDSDKKIKKGNPLVEGNPSLCLVCFNKRHKIRINSTFPIIVAICAFIIFLLYLFKKSVINISNMMCSYLLGIWFLLD